MFYKVIVLTMNDFKNLAWDLVSLANDWELEVNYDFIKDELESILETEEVQDFYVEYPGGWYYDSPETLANHILDYMKEHKLLES